jgi:ubiquinone/menaquinone biosynthesis C-methylase UbiE
VANVDANVVKDFGDEWARFDQTGVASDELRGLFEEYFSVFPWELLPPHAEGFDVGCGSGRWAYHVAQRVGTLHCVDPAAEALAVARTNLGTLSNCRFHQASVDELPFANGTMDFGYSLGVLHHVPDTRKGLADCVSKLRPGAPMLVYLYYAFDNRPLWFKAIWRASDLVRRAVCVLPAGPKVMVTNAIAYLVYWPLSRTAWLLERFGIGVSAFPLSAYRDKSMYTLKTDARDRFGTRLEQRFTKDQIKDMMLAAGLERIAFREGSPYWCAVGVKAASQSQTANG